MGFWVLMAMSLWLGFQENNSLGLFLVVVLVVVEVTLVLDFCFYLGFGIYYFIV